MIIPAEALGEEQAMLEAIGRNESGNPVVLWKIIELSTSFEEDSDGDGFSLRDAIGLKTLSGANRKSALFNP